mmetsp:Transcript_32457/g.92493  ORF Transcript_32457/g.92493 Transcript_32457/m.92493 type:complete len:266 (+) Transcript_32457:42-839(+)
MAAAAVTEGSGACTRAPTAAAAQMDAAAEQIGHVVAAEGELRGDCKDDVAGGHSDAESTVGASSQGDARATPTCGSSDGSTKMRARIVELVSWERVALGTKIKPHCTSAHCAADIYLLSAFLTMSRLQDIGGDGIRLLLRALKFLRLCDYSAEDIASILAHTCEYMKDVLKVCGDRMDAQEVGNVVVCLMFMAHSWSQDETCPLRVWHRHIFREYCSIKTLNLAVVRLFELRRYRMRLPTQKVIDNMERLQAAVPWSGALLHTSS